MSENSANQPKYKILIADSLAQEGVELLEGSSLFSVDFQKKTSADELMQKISEYHGLIIRSASKVTREVIGRAKNLRVVVRAGVGVDNVDIPTCSQRGIVVMNAPAGNTVSTAEHTIALMFSLARRLPQAHSSMKEKKWEKSKFKGVQLTEKTLGVIGLGRIGKEVVKRARGLQMNVIGHDPYIPVKNLEHLQIKLADVETILKDSDFITVHTPLTDLTKHLIHQDNVDQLKQGVYLINCARGGIYEVEALVAGLSSGRIAGVGLDVFEKEPPSEDDPLYAQENCVMSPHLGASTEEAQIEVARESASSMIEYFKSGIALNSFNFPTLDPEEMDILTPWFNFIEKTGYFSACLMSDPLDSVRIKLSGTLANLNFKPLEIAFAKGALKPSLGSRVNQVNAPVLAKEREMHIVSEKLTNEASMDMVEIVVQSESERLNLKGIVNFMGGSIIEINSMNIEFKLDGHMLYILNEDIPKVVGELGLILGDSHVNIASLQLTRESKGGLALTIIHLDSKPPEETIKKIREKAFIKDARYIFVQ